MADDFPVGDEVLSAFADLPTGGGAAERLRPVLRARAESATGDPVLAGLVAQQVLVDLASRTATDFETPSDLAGWLGIRVSQTAALFSGMLAAPASSEATPPPVRSGAVLGGLALAWRRRVRLPAVVAATGIASLAAASAAVVLTTTQFTPPPPTPAPNYPISAPTQLSPHLVPTPTPTPPATSPARPAPTPTPAHTPAPAAAPAVAAVASRPPATPTPPPPPKPPAPSPPTSTPPTPTPTPPQGCGRSRDEDDGHPPGGCPERGGGCRHRDHQQDHHQDHDAQGHGDDAVPTPPVPRPSAASGSDADRSGH